MAEPTTELMEELLKMIDEQQSQELSGTRPLRSRATSRLERSPATKGIPASRTKFADETDREPAKSLEGDFQPSRLAS
jgi:hypothetical protein